MFGEPDVERLWDAYATAVRLDEPDPVAAWREHTEKLHARCRSSTSSPSTRSTSAGPAPT